MDIAQYLSSKKNLVLLYGQDMNHIVADIYNVLRSALQVGAEAVELTDTGFVWYKGDKIIAKKRRVPPFWYPPFIRNNPKELMDTYHRTFRLILQKDTVLSSGVKIDDQGDRISIKFIK